MITKVLFWTITAFGLIIGACSGLWWQLEEVQHLRPIYRCLAKLVVTHPVEPLAKSVAKGPNTEFYGTCIETIESAEMLRKARERVHATHPDVEEFDVGVRVARTKDSGILNILASGEDPKYTQIFLNAILDEYLALRTAIAEQHFGKLLSTQLQQVVEREQYLVTANQQHRDAWQASSPANRKAEEQRLITRLTTLRDMRDTLDLEIKLAAGSAEQSGNRSKLETLNSEIKQTETQLVEVSTALLNFENSVRALDQAQTQYNSAFSQASNTKLEMESHTDVVAIQERATSASAHEPDPNPMLIAGFVVGAIVGALMGLVAAWLLTWRPTKVMPTLQD